MKRRLILACFIAVLAAFGFESPAQDFPAAPNPPRLVNDFANMLTEAEAQALESKLVAFDDSTSSQIAIVTVNTINGYDVSDYAFRLAEDWGIGQQGKNNGILILVALDDRKMFIATGYGVEASVPDVVAFRIVDRILKPNFRNEDYYQGLDEATNRLMGLISGEFEAEPEESGKSGFMFFMILLLFIVVIIIISRRGGGKGGNRGRGGGFFPPIVTLGNPYRSGSSWGDFSGGGGSFGGFGGGSFGGGGAGGSW